MLEPAAVGFIEQIVGIDPGTSKTGICRIVFSRERAEAAFPNILDVDIIANGTVIPYLRELERQAGPRHESIAVAVEGLVSYGNAWGNETIRTAYFIGRLLHHLEANSAMPFDLFSRKQYGQWLTDGGTTNDANVKSALETTYGSFKPATKKRPQAGPLAPLAGRTSDKRSAFAVAKYYEYRLGEIYRGSGKSLPPSLYVPLELTIDG